MTRSDLLDLVYQFYPRGLICGGLGYSETEEVHRHREAARRGVARYPIWKGMVRRLGARYRITDRSLSLSSGSLDPAYSGYVLIPRRTLGFHVCLLGSYYAVHRTGADGEEPVALDIGREIESTYPGYEPILPELGNVIVPDVCVRGFGVATIYDCLFSEEWRTSSQPYDDTKSPTYLDPDAPHPEDEAPDPADADAEPDGPPIHYNHRGE